MQCSRNKKTTSKKLKAMHEFFAFQLELLEQERKSEMEEGLVFSERKSLKDLVGEGIALLGVTVEATRSGPGGQTIYEFVKPYQANLPFNSFTPGDLVQLTQGKGIRPSAESATGTVFRLTPSSISIVLSDPLADSPLHNIFKISNDVTFRRCKEALLEMAQGNHTLHSILFNNEQLDSQLALMKAASSSFLTPELPHRSHSNESQQEKELAGDAGLSRVKANRTRAAV